MKTPEFKLWKMSFSILSMAFILSCPAHSRADSARLPALKAQTGQYSSVEPTKVRSGDLSSKDLVIDISDHKESATRTSPNVKWTYPGWSPHRYDHIDNYTFDYRLGDIDIFEDNPIYLGTYASTPFDKPKNYRNWSGVPENLDPNPLVPILQAGIKSEF